MDSLNWGQKMVHANSEEVESKQKIKVALIDSGVNYSTDIDVVERKNFIPGHEDISPLYEDISGHGTNIAGVIAAKDNDSGITGVNPNVELYSAKVLDANNQAPISRVIEAIDWAISKDVDIINLSFTTEINSGELLAAIQRAYESDILLVAAAGNSEDGSQRVKYPAAYPEVVAVGSVNSMGEVSSFSPKGSQVELVAPGELVTSTDVFDTVSTHSGTSYAAPYVTAIAAKLWEQDAECSRDFIRAVLDISANLYGNEQSYGYGLVDYEFAQKVFDALKPMAESEQDFEKILNYAVNICRITNSSSVPVMGETENMVEGAWLQADHADMVDEFELKNTNGRNLLLAGCWLPDSEATQLHSKYLRPQFHGSYKYQNGTDRRYTNYIAGGLYLSRVAHAMLSGNEYNVTDSVCSGVAGYINNTYINKKAKIRWADVEGKIEYYTGCDFQPTNRIHRALVIYGMSLHSIGDIFAHSATFVRGDGSLGVIKKPNDDKRSEGSGKSRYAAAKAVCQEALRQICGITGTSTTSHKNYSNYGYCNISIFRSVLNNKEVDLSQVNLACFETYAWDVCNKSSILCGENVYDGEVVNALHGGNPTLEQ